MRGCVTRSLTLSCGMPRMRQPVSQFIQTRNLRLAHRLFCELPFAARAELRIGSHRIAPMALDVPSDSVCGTRVNPEEEQLRALCQ